jgi:acetolactate synthase-1/3 small subunit
VDIAPETLIVEITGTGDKIDGLVEILRPFGILELVRTGAVAMLRGAETRTTNRIPAGGNSNAPEAA